MMFEKVKKIFAKFPFWGQSSGTNYITNSVLHETVTVPMKLGHIMCVITVPVRFSRIGLVLEGDLWGFSIGLSFPIFPECRKCMCRKCTL